MSEKTDYEIDEQLAQELVDKLQLMVDDRDKKLKMAKEQLVEQLKVTADKYRTATGVMESLRVLRMVMNVDDVKLVDELSYARDITADMIIVVSNMTEKAERLGYAEMSELCEGFYDEDFVSRDFCAVEIAKQLMCIDLCRNVGPAAEDMACFIEKTQGEINDVKAELDGLVAAHPEFAELAPTSKE